MLDFELLRAFVAVADCGGFHRPAERLNLTQSTISQQIKRLEFETKRPLFRRTMRSVALTDDGEMLLGDARRLLQLEGGPPSPLSGGNSLTVTSAAEQAPVSATFGLRRRTASRQSGRGCRRQ
jgi:DNA-binding transcriptional LysR family regulator